MVTQKNVSTYGAISVIWSVIDIWLDREQLQIGFFSKTYFPSCARKMFWASILYMYHGFDIILSKKTRSTENIVNVKLSLNGLKFKIYRIECNNFLTHLFFIHSSFNGKIVNTADIVDLHGKTQQIIARKYNHTLNPNSIWGWRQDRPRKM